MFCIIIKSFGDLLIDLRTKNNLTQKNLATLIDYTPKQLHRIEKNICNPSIELILSLSEYYKIDLLQYYKLLINNVSLESYAQFTQLRKSIEKADYQQVERLYKEYEILPSFSQGENLNLINYAKALCCLNNKNYFQSINYCLESLQYSCVEDFFSGLSAKEIYTNTTYNLISCVGFNLYFLNKIDQYESILLLLHENISKHFFSKPYIEHMNSSFIIRFYSVLLNNLSDLNIRYKKYTAALTYITKAIEYSTEIGNGLGILDSFFFTKFQCHYHLSQYEEASISFDNCMILSKIFKKNNDMLKRISSLSSKYPSMLNIINIDELHRKYNCN